MTQIKPILLGCSGTVLCAEEAAFFSKTQPFGFILFKRNCETPNQLSGLVRALRESVGREDAPVFIDQEGGSVQRLNPPHWPSYPALRHIGLLYENDPALGRKAMHLHSLLIASMLRSVGINGNCAPVLDLRIDGASRAIGDRALSRDPRIVADCGRVAVDAYLSQGVFPVIKHLPGHGRVVVDPHIDLPFVDAAEADLEADFAPFNALADAPMAMNCHVVFRSLDAANPVSLSKEVHEHILREKIGFKGLIFSDDLAMGALKLPLAERAVAALGAGADVALYCTGNLEENRIVCEPLAPMKVESLARWEKAKGHCCANPEDIDVSVMRERFDRLMEIAVTLAA